MLKNTCFFYHILRRMTTLNFSLTFSKFPKESFANITGLFVTFCPQGGVATRIELNSLTCKSGGFLLLKLLKTTKLSKLVNNICITMALSSILIKIVQFLTKTILNVVFSTIIICNHKKSSIGGSNSVVDWYLLSPP